MVVTEPRCDRVPGHVDVPRPDRHARASTSCATSDSWAKPSERAPRADPLRERPRAGREPARRRGPGVRDRADPARRWPHPPRDAHGRHVPEGARHDVRARACHARRRASSSPTSRACRTYIADSYAELSSSGCFVLYTAWRSTGTRTTAGPPRHRRGQVPDARGAADIVHRSIQVHGALGVSNELPFGRMWMRRRVMALVDGPTEVHKVTTAREMLKGYKPADGLWPTEWLPRRRKRRAPSSRRSSSTRSPTRTHSNLRQLRGLYAVC